MAVIAVIGLDRLRARFADIITKFPAQVDAEIQYAGIACQKYAKQLCPVDTGRLRSSIQYTNMGLMKSMTGTDVFYGFFLEFGTRKMSPRAFLRPAFEKARVELIQNLKALKV
jgi:HK97 gp10 family phage protein